MLDLWLHQATIVRENIVRRLRSAPSKLAECVAQRGITQAADVKPGPARANGCCQQAKNMIRMP